MNFWQLNKKRILTICIVEIATSFFIIYSAAPIMDQSAFLWVAGVSIILFIPLFMVSFLPAINGFRVVRRLTTDTTDYSILPLFDTGYEIGLQHETSWLFYTTPCIKATISGLPVTISFTPSSRSSWSQISFTFSPLAREGSKRIYTNGISFTLYVVKRLQKDIKPEVLQCVAETKEKGLTSGVGRTISAKHYDTYDD